MVEAKLIKKVRHSSKKSKPGPDLINKIKRRI